VRAGSVPAHTTFDRDSTSFAFVFGHLAPVVTCSLMMMMMTNSEMVRSTRREMDIERPESTDRRVEREREKEKAAKARHMMMMMM
jgi:hypothetical protein